MVLQVFNHQKLHSEIQSHFCFWIFIILFLPKWTRDDGIQIKIQRGEIWKGSFISTIRPTVHANLSR